MRSQRNTLGWVFICFVIVSAALNCSAQIRYFRQPTVPFVQNSTRPLMIASQDSIANDTLFQLLSPEGHPVAYYRKIRTSVCFDNKCRLLKCLIYWNVTGRYLGFELPKGEFLSKAEHKAFTPQEYERLSGLLADQNSPLRVLSYSELAPQLKTTGDDVDGVSSATAKNVLDYVVEGAAYTTYKMWHVVYGPTQEDVEKLTEKALTTAYALKILRGPDPDDRIWALNHIKGHIAFTSELRSQLFEWISDKNFSLAERAINAFGPAEMRSDTVQLLMLEKFGQTGYSLKKQIIAKWRDAPALNSVVSHALTEKLDSLSGELVNNILDLLSKHQVQDRNTVQLVARLLANPNQFTAQKALQFLKNADVRDATILKKMEEYGGKE